VQLLCPDLHPLNVAASELSASVESAPGAPSLTSRVAALESEVTTLRETIRKLAVALGQPDPFGRE
jgi:hypothetical protein